MRCARPLRWGGLRVCSNELRRLLHHLVARRAGAEVNARHTNRQTPCEIGFAGETAPILRGEKWAGRAGAEIDASKNPSNTALVCAARKELPAVATVRLGFARAKIDVREQRGCEVQAALDGGGHCPSWSSVR